MNIKVGIIVLIWLLATLVPSAESKRSEPAPVAPALYHGVKYSAPHYSENGIEVRPGYIQARDARTNQLLWELQVYSINYKSGLERDVQDIFITSLKIVNNALIVDNERGERFKVNLHTRRIENLR